VTTSTPFGQRGLELGQLGLHAVDDVEGVFALAHDHDAAHHVALTVVVGDAPPHLRAQRHGGHVLDRDGRAVFGLEHQLLEIADPLHVAAPAHHVLAARQLDQAAAHVVVALAHGLDHRFERQLVRGQRVRIDGDLVLADLAAHGRDLGHARHALHGVAKNQSW
jgi:hypothetical protein